MTTASRLNLWMASTTNELDALGSASGVALGDFCLVDASNLYVATTVGASSSTWRPIAGLPTTGPIGLGGRNLDDTLNRALFVLTGVSFRAVLDATPSTITLASTANSNWPTVPTLLSFTTTGFTLSGTSSSVAPNTDAWMRGTYTIAY